MHNSICSNALLASIIRARSNHRMWLEKIYETVRHQKTNYIHNIIEQVRLEIKHNDNDNDNACTITMYHPVVILNTG